jgi:DMSO reductase anchor subunit
VLGDAGPDCVILPGHGPATTAAEELVSNPFLASVAADFIRHAKSKRTFVITFPSLYKCNVNHTRVSPKKHAFDYRVFMLAFDLDSFPKLPLLSRNRFNLFSIDDRDHIRTDPQKSMRENLTTWLANHGTEIPADSRITLPTTRYIGRPLPTTSLAADREKLHPEHAHWPLVFMLSLTQAGLGLSCVAAIAGANKATLPILITGAVLFNLGMVAATLHLGQPLKAWRFFLGLKTSWLSREILAFSMVAPLPLVLIALALTPNFPFKDQLTLITTLSAIPAALGAIFTSIMIYVDTKRKSWRFPITAPRFFGSFICFLLIALAIIRPEFSIFATFAIMLKMIPEGRVLKSTDPEEPEWSADVHSARLQLFPLRRILNARVILAFVAAFTVLVSPWLALAILLISEILERQLFFQSCYAPKMPGQFG